MRSGLLTKFIATGFPHLREASGLPEGLLPDFAEVVRTLGADTRAIRLEFSGKNEKTTDLFVRNLWRNLPVFLRLLGLGSVKEVSEDKKPKKD